MADRKKLVVPPGTEVKEHGYKPEKPITIIVSPDKDVGAGHQPEKGTGTKPTMKPPPKKP